jgi:uncharacterized protein (DUF427 family)
VAAKSLPLHERIYVKGAAKIVADRHRTPFLPEATRSQTLYFPLEASANPNIARSP